MSRFSYERLSLIIIIVLSSLLWNHSLLLAQEKPIQFSEIALSLGVEFQHHSPLTAERHLHGFLGSGLGWLDYDLDGWDDLYCCQGASWESMLNPGGTRDLKQSNALYRNQSGVRFSNVTPDAGLKEFGYSMGVAIGDFDNDGFPDIYVNNFGVNRLFWNLGDGTFSEVGTAAGVNAGGFGSGCTWADYDNDGDLDLFVVNYLKLDLKNYPVCDTGSGSQKVAVGCHPRYLPAEYDILYENQSDGTFIDVSQKVGLRTEPARQGLGIVAVDFNQDGWMDFYLANDEVPNQLWINDGKGGFTDQSLISGTAVNRGGQWEAGMGVAAGDIDGDLTIDLFVTNFYKETNTLYRNEGALFFLDVTNEFGLAAPSQFKLGFGTNLFDADNDGWLDLFVANGHIKDLFPSANEREPFQQKPQLFKNRNGKRFQDVSETAGNYFSETHLGRGSAVSDFNHDGFADLAVQQLNAPLVILKNKTQTANRLLSMRLIGTESNRSGIGARVEIRTDQRRFLKTKMGSSSYLSSDAAEIYQGLVAGSKMEEIVVHWPGGTSEAWYPDQNATRLTLLQGTGRKIPPGSTGAAE
ncbi:CRTAC1 family protein [Gimesia maris]|uniref:CRTAC1 family protein n=1 Tax=Gimesia maris TaxID=122 RepID=UPI0032F0481A